MERTVKLAKAKGHYVISNPKLNTVNEMLLESGSAIDIDIKLTDSRTISAEQRNFIWALCGEMSYYTGDDKEYVRLLMQQYNANIRGYEIQSLSSCSVTYANELIDTIINFCIEKEIPFAQELIKKNGYEFTEKQTYSMCLKRVCVICGQRADLHHVDSVGMGHNRNKIDHTGKRMLPLCRVHHNEAHTIGDDKLIARYHLTPIIIDDKLEYFIKRGIIKEHKEKK